MPQCSLPPWPYYSEEEIEAAAQVLRSGKVNFWTGSDCTNFEQEFARWVGVGHAISLANGTVALELCLRGLEIGSGDEVIVPARSFVASATCVAAIGARPVFADVAPDSGNLTAETIEPLRSARTRAVIVVHLAGWPADMDPIMDWAQRHDIKVIEDCAQAHGARYRGRSIGSIGHAAAWSFCQDKIMSTGGEGGMITTSDAAIWSRVWSAKDHGKSWNAMFESKHGPGFRWVHESLGGNGRMTGMQAAIGRIQLARMPLWHAARARNAAIIAEQLAPLASAGAVSLPDVSGAATTQGDETRHAWYRYLFQIEPQALLEGWTRQRVIDVIIAAGVPAFTGPCPEIYLERVFDGTGWRPTSRLPVARQLGEASIALLVHPTITAEQAAQAGMVVANVLREATGT